ncbi:hypothetical protein [Halospeciosus flavus]|uniref:DUF5666 domain-containing protein n=1 Tax=Halospeciosus flavus TaxID=3032283 RepID=A0ABD5Z265_9EURY|nr:hypothetical protein [Halospeciosus flavus]
MDDHVLAVAAVSALAVGSGGFSSVSADRIVEVNVVESQNAYVGVLACEKANATSNATKNGTNPVRITVTNRYTEAITVVAIHDDRGTTIPQKTKASLRPGESQHFSGHANESVIVDIAGDGLSANITADVRQKGRC